MLINVPYSFDSWYGVAPCQIARLLAKEFRGLFTMSVVVFHVLLQVLSGAVYFQFQLSSKKLSRESVATIGHVTR